MTPDTFEPARDLLRDAHEAGAFPAAVIEVGARAGSLWREAFGRLTYDSEAPVTRPDTLFDLASLTKVLSTTSILMRLVESATLRLDDPVGRWLPEWQGADREGVTLEDLLVHASGLTAYLPFFRDHHGRAEFQRAICTMPLEYVPRTRALYSDLGFILLGFLIETVGGCPLTTQFAPIASQVHPEPLTFNPRRELRRRTAPTEVDPWRGRLLAGDVHDENAWALGGAAGHAGLFGTAGSVGGFARWVLETADGRDGLARPDTLARFFRRSDVPGSSRALGWDTMLPTSSCGSRMSAAAVGHTGFTGTSLWLDPALDVYIVLLTNRVHPSRDNEAMARVRPAVHDAVMAGLFAAR